MKKTIMFLGVLSLGLAQAQQGRVGINTDEPKATLQVKSTSPDEAKGVLIPQLAGDEMKTMTNTLTADQHGLITFATNGVTTLDNIPTNNVQFEGYHRFNMVGTNKSWVRLEPSGLEKIKGERDKTGWRLIGNNQPEYGKIGNKAIDFSGFVKNNTSTNNYGATGEYSIAQGINNKVSGKASGVFGVGSTVTGGYSFAFGEDNTITEWGSIAMGRQSKASGYVSFAAGNGAKAEGHYSVALGHNSSATGEYSFAAGASKAYATGNGAIAMGRFAKALGYGSIAMGEGVISTGTLGTAMGGYNTEGEKHFVIGDGDNSVRSDAFSIIRNAASKSSKIGIDIDNFETTTSDAKLQVNGAIKVDSKTGTLTCNEHNAGTMSYKEVNGSGVFGFCTKKESGEYVWAYLKGAHLHGESTNGGAFGSGL